MGRPHFACLNGGTEDHLVEWCLEWVLYSPKGMCSQEGGCPGGASGKESGCQCRKCKRRGFDSWVKKIPWRRKWQPTPVFLPGKSHGQRSMAGSGPWDGRVKTRLTHSQERRLRHPPCHQVSLTISSHGCHVVGKSTIWRLKAMDDTQIPRP